MPPGSVKLSLLLFLLFAPETGSAVTIVQRPGDRHLAIEPELGDLVSLGGTGSAFSPLFPVAPPGADGRVLVATPGSNGNGTTRGTRVQFTLRFASPGKYRLYFRSAVATGAAVASSDSFFIFDDWGNSGEPVQESESGLSGFDFGWFTANSLSAIDVAPNQTGQDLVFSIANREARFIVDKLVLVQTSVAPTTAQLDAWSSPLEISPGVAALKPVHLNFREKFQFGYSVDVDDGLAIVGALGDRSEQEDGSVYVFDTRTGVQLARIEDTSPNAINSGIEYAEFGRSVAVSDGMAVIASGFHFDIENYQNHAFLYNARSGAYVTELVPSGTTKPLNNFQVDIDGSRAVVGATHASDIDTEENSEPGAAFVFAVPSGVQTALLRAPEGRVNDGFGASVALQNGLALVGATSVDGGGFLGAAYLFDADTGAALLKLIPSLRANRDEFGASVALDGDLLVVGAPFATFPPFASDERPGAVFIFDRWSGAQLRILTAVNPVPGARFGAAVSVSNGRILVGAPADCGASPSGASLFDADTGQLLLELPSPDFDAGCFAADVALNDDSLLVGSSEYWNGSAYLVSDLGRIIPLPGTFRESGGLLVIEAEHFAGATSTSSHAWISNSGPAGFVGAAAMLAAPNVGVTVSANPALTSPSLTYRAYFTAGGTYQFWIRGWAANGSDDSVFVGMNGQAAQSLAYSQTGTWMWRSRPVVIPGPGVHELNLWMREDGARVDRLLLAADPAYVPTGAGPPESSQ